jgi:hypothetical protein
MKRLLLLYILLANTVSAESDLACLDASSNYFKEVIMSDGNKIAFKPHCLPNSDGDLKERFNIHGNIIQVGNQAMCAMTNSSNQECIDPEIFLQNDNSCANSNDKDGCQNNDFTAVDKNSSVYLGIPDYDDLPANSDTNISLEWNVPNKLDNYLSSKNLII